MNKHLLHSTIAVALGVATTLASAANVNLSNWAYGDSWGNTVSVGSPDHTGAAGGFKGAVQFAPGGELGFSGTLNNVITYCVEIQESFTLPSGNMAGYNVVTGAGYGEWTNANNNGKTATATANRLGQLLSYVASDATLVDTAAESTSLQLAIWNIIYDTDNTVASGIFREKSNAAYDSYADTLLTASSHWNKLLDVYVLTKSGSQDFVLTKDTGRVATSGLEGIGNVPEPASLALVVLALGAAGATARRRTAAAA